MAYILTGNTIFSIPAITLITFITISFAARIAGNNGIWYNYRTATRGEITG